MNSLQKAATPIALAVLAVLAVSITPGASGATRKPRKITVGAKASGRTLHLKRGDRLVVQLYDYSASTAYRWRLVVRPRKSVLPLVSATAVGAPVTVPPTVGAPNTLYYTFKAKNAGTTHIRFGLVSTFKAKDRPTKRHLRLKVVVG